MKPAPFRYVAPRELDEVLSLLAESGDDAKVLAGGQTLGPMLNLRVLAPSLLIDVNGVPELARRDATRGLTLGALTRQSELEDDASLRERQPLVAAAVPLIAHRPIRNRGTVGGSLAHADPAAEWGALALALDAELLIARQGAPVRVVAATEFFTGMLETAVGADELLVAVRLPPWPRGSGASFRELSPRHGDFALAGIACRLAVDGAGRCRETRLALIGVGDRPVRIAEAEAMMAGETPDDALFEEVAEAAAQAVEPLSDLHASGAFRRTLARVLVRDALREALAGARRRPDDGVSGIPVRDSSERKAPQPVQANRSAPVPVRESVLSLTVNGRPVTRAVRSRTTLSDFLRHELGLTGTHVGCEHGVCGACTVLVDGRAVRSCILYAIQADGAQVRTVEDLADGDALHPLQHAFGERGALQCGYCTSGFLMSALDLLSRNPTPDEYQVREALSGNLCRCTGYEPIVDAVLSVAAANASG